MALGTLNIPNNSKIEEEINSLKNPTFDIAPSRSNINSEESHTTIFGKIKKYFNDLKTHAFNNPANNLTTASSGSYALDAYQGKVLNDKINGLKTIWRDFFSASATISKTYTYTFPYGVSRVMVMSSMNYDVLYYGEWVVLNRGDGAFNVVQTVNFTAPNSSLSLSVTGNCTGFGISGSGGDAGGFWAGCVVVM